MLRKITYSLIVSVIVLFSFSCTDNPTSNDPVVNRGNQTEKLDVLLNSDVYVQGYVKYNGAGVPNHPVQILDENQNPFNYPPYAHKTSITYTNAQGNYIIQVCGFGLGLRHVKVTYNNITQILPFEIPYERPPVLYITKNFQFGYLGHEPEVD